MVVPTLKRCNGQRRNRKAHSAHPKHRAAIGSIRPAEHSCTPPISLDAGKVLDSDTGIEYSINVQLGDGVQVISASTGKRWVAGWDELIDLAIAAGIDKEGG